MKKLYVFIMVFLLAGMLTGCASGNIPITEEESDAIAQYCAHLLLKYDNNKTDDRKLMDKDELKDHYKELEKANPTPTPTQAPTSTPEATKAPKPSKAEDETNDVTPTEAIPTADNKAESLTELYGLKGFDVKYSSGSLTKTYNENDYSTITARDGEMIFSASFKIKNNGKESQKFVSSDSSVSYILYCENGNSYTPQISMLSNDIQFLNDEIGVKKDFAAVLLFVVSETDVPATLRAEDGKTGKVYDIKIK